MAKGRRLHSSLCRRAADEAGLYGGTGTSLETKGIWRVAVRLLTVESWREGGMTTVTQQATVLFDEKTMASLETRAMMETILGLGGEFFEIDN
ncbi:unnamed protein product [Linum trigynum]|uniref:Uncharacterized protein n=1 Tax=Linum trigynum TaxID=586398 RepID=A0AAV2DAA0_9ROSI